MAIPFASLSDALPISIHKNLTVSCAQVTVKPCSSYFLDTSNSFICTGLIQMIRVPEYFEIGKFHG